MFAGKDRKLIRTLIYPVQFEKDPTSAVDRIAGQIEKGKVLVASPLDYFNAIRSGLESTEQLSGLIPQNHSEQVIREYLRSLNARLEAMPAKVEEA